MKNSKESSIGNKIRGIFTKDTVQHKLTKKQRMEYMYDFDYDTKYFKSNTEYLAYWLELIGMSVYFTNADNGNLLILNVGDNNNTYIIYPAFFVGKTITEEDILKIEERQQQMQSIPVVFSYDQPDDYVATVASKRGIQFINESQLRGINKLILTDELPSGASGKESFISQIASYLRTKISY